jgi:hypothetical protein
LPYFFVFVFANQRGSIYGLFHYPSQCSAPNEVARQAINLQRACGCFFRFNNVLRYLFEKRFLFPCQAFDTDNRGWLPADKTIVGKKGFGNSRNNTKRRIFAPLKTLDV